MADEIPMNVRRALDECHSLGVWLKEQLGHDDGSATLVSLEVIRKALTSKRYRRRTRKSSQVASPR